MARPTVDPIRPAVGTQRTMYASSVSGHSESVEQGGARKLWPAKPAHLSQVSRGQANFSNHVGDDVFQSIELAAQCGVDGSRIAHL